MWGAVREDKWKAVNGAGSAATWLTRCLLRVRPNGTSDPPAQNSAVPHLKLFSSVRKLFFLRQQWRGRLPAPHTHTHKPHWPGRRKHVHRVCREDSTGNAKCEVNQCCGLKHGACSFFFLFFFTLEINFRREGCGLPVYDTRATHCARSHEKLTRTHRKMQNAKTIIKEFKVFY